MYSSLKTMFVCVAAIGSLCLLAAYGLAIIVIDAMAYAVLVKK